MDLLESQTIQCPYCWEQIETQIDRSQPEQQFTEDCQVCCNPILFHVSIDMEGAINVDVQPENID